MTDQSLPSQTTPLPPVKEWRLHLGVHKTATTHLQYRLQALAPELHEHGLDVLLPEMGVRQLRLSRVAESPPKLWKLRPLRTERLTAPLQKLRSGPDRVIVSEEQILGRLGQLVYGQPYNKQGYIGALLGRLSQQADVHLFLSLRSYESFLPSAYAQVIRYHPAPAGGFDTVRKTFDAQGMSWLALVKNLRRAVPKASLTLWRYEDYQPNADQILDTLCGFSIPNPPDVPPPSRTRAGATPAVAAAEALPPDLAPKDRKARVAEIYNDPTFDGPRFDPFTPAEKTALRDRYNREWEEICRLMPQETLNFS